MILILFILASFGASYIATQSFLFERIRNAFNGNKYLRYFGIPHTLVILCYPFDIFPKHS